VKRTLPEFRPPKKSDMRGMCYIPLAEQTKQSWGYSEANAY
jgi:hypothetical protein